MRNEIEDLKQQAVEQAKQQLKEQVKEATKKVGKQIWSAIAPVLPWILLVLVIFIIIIGCIDWGDLETKSSAEDMYSTSSSSWNQFLKFVLTNEGGSKTADGKYYIVEDDSAGNPTVGHGLCLKSQDGYLNVDEFKDYNIDSKKLADDWIAGKRDGKVEVDICDEIWENKLKVIYEGTDGTGGIKNQYSSLGLKVYQYYALVDVKYRRGNTDGFLEAYNSKWSSSDDKYGEDSSSESFSDDSLYSFFLNGWTDTTSGVYTRKKNQWLLFKYGYYVPLNEYWVKSYSGELLEVALNLHEEQKNWSYSTDTLTSNDIDLAINSPYKTTCCATYVSSIIYKAGYETKEQMNSFNYNSSTALRNHFINRGWKEITSYEELEAGDIVFMNTTGDGGRDIEDICHVQMCAGTDQWYNAGSDSAIQGEAPKTYSAKDGFICALRPNVLK